MDSSLSVRWWPLLFFLGLMCLGAGLAGWHHASARLLVLSLLLVAMGFICAVVQLRRNLARNYGAARSPTDVDQDLQRTAQRQVLTLMTESQVEHAPVALWQQQGQGQVEALNNAARRLIAPGGTSDRQVFLASLGEQARSAAEGAGRHSLFTFASERGTERCLLACRSLVIRQVPVRYLALMPIESELEAEALKAWRQLVHILTHEIMNSLTPIASLSRTALEMLVQKNGRGGANTEDLSLSLDTIARRADSLIGFVGSYRRVSELPEPQLEPVDLGRLFARLEQLVGADWRGKGGSAVFEVEPTTLSLMADAGQLEQALLNLIKNAAQATAELSQPTLVVRARLVRGGRLRLEVCDNGPGVPSGMENNIFLPFFSTRPATRPGTEAIGQGIGLAVVRNLVHGMGGSVRYVKAVGGGAIFVLTF